MARSLAPTLFFLLLFAVPGSAQSVLAVGDIGFVNQTPGAFYVLRATPPCSGATSAQVNAYSILPPVGNTEAILWDPAVPDSFIIGGAGFIGRATVTAFTGSATWTVITTSVGTVRQMAWDANGDVVFADRTADQIGVCNLSTGGVTYITAGLQPWASRLDAVAVHVASGDIYAASHNAVYRMAAGNAPVLLAGGWCPQGNNCQVSGLAIDPTTNDILASTINPPELYRITQAGTWAFEVPAGTLATGSRAITNGLGPGLGSDFIVGSGNSASCNARVYCVTGGVATAPFGALAPGGPSCGARGVAVVGASTLGPPVNSDFAVTVSGTTSLTFNLINPPIDPVTMTVAPQGVTLVSATLPALPGGGPFVGLVPDFWTFQLFVPVPTPGSPFHWAGPPPFPFTVPAGAASGMTLDIVTIAMDGTFTVLDVTPVIRVPFPC